jgi:ABC-type multidrug transport system fused ATPase/permease subunit
MRTLPVSDPGVPDTRSAARYLIWLATQHWSTVTAGMLLGSLWMLLLALIPAAIGAGIDAGLVARDSDALLRWGLIVLALGVGQAVVGILRHRFAVYNWLAAAYRTVQVVTDRANRLGATLPKRLTAGEVVGIGASDIEHLGSALDILSRGTGALVGVVAVTAILLGTSAPLGLVVLIGVPLLMAVVAALIRPLHSRQERHRDQQSVLTSRAADLVSGLRVIKGIGGEDTLAARYRAESQALRGQGVRVARVESLLEGAQVLLPGIFMVLVTWLGARFALRGTITVGELVTFYSYAAFLVLPLRTLTELVDSLTLGHVAARRVVRLCRLTPEFTDPPRPAPAPPPGSELVDAASGVALRPGELTALVAAVPEEATAVVERLARYVDGEVTLGGVPLRELPMAEVRKRILLAENESRLFTGPLRAELDPHDRADPTEVEAALGAASATDIVAGAPHGLATLVTGGGREFSGGQRQRLRLARALVAAPEILILVEPTSAVDAHTEARIAQGLSAARRDRTTLVCTTSPLLLHRADRVVFLRDGKAVAEGSHAELLATEPGYAAIVTREVVP